MTATHDPAARDAGHGHEAISPEEAAPVLARFAEPERRVEGVDKVTGRAPYAADHALPGMLWARSLLSQVPHARIISVDVTRAREIPGVHAVLTGEDVRGQRYGRRLLDRPLLAWDRVRFVGDRIAVVAAETPEAAEEAVAAIDLELEELPAILDPEAALAADAPILHPDAAEYTYVGGQRPPVPHPNVQGRLATSQGEADLEPIFASAPHVFEDVFRTPREHHGAIERHATLAWFDESDVLHVVTTNKTPYGLRTQLSNALGIPAARIDVDAGAIGGDFGGKGYSIDEFLCALLAKATGRPIKAVASPAEEFGATNVRHAAVMRLRTAVDTDGRFLAHEASILLDGGAYAAAKPLPHLSLAGAIATLAPYRVPNVRIETRTVYTNTVPGGHVRSPGEVQALFAGESHVDAIARALGIDPLEFRLRNAVRGDEIGAAGYRFRETRAVEVLETVRREMDWDRPRPAGRGRGIALGVRHVGGGALPLRLVVSADGGLTILTGMPEQGAGAWTVMRRVLAAVAGVDESRVTVRKTTTAGGPPDPGVGGSRVTHLASRAAEQLGRQVRDWLEERIPSVLPSATAGTRLHDDELSDPDAPGPRIGFGEAVAKLLEPDAPLELSASFDGAAHGPDEPGDYDFAACAVEVEVDRATGAFRLTDALLAVDVGTVVNPIAHRGQLEGGFVFGLGAAVMEELPVDNGAVTALSLADVKYPNIGDVPPLRLALLPTDQGPGAFGAKMAGELTNTLVPPTVANAVADAAGVRITELPISAERVQRALGG